MKLTTEQARLLRKESRGGKNTLEALGLIVVTDAGRAWVARDDERISKARSLAGQHDTNREDIARAGGKARAKKLTKARKKEIAQQARAQVGQSE